MLDFALGNVAATERNDCFEQLKGAQGDPTKRQGRGTIDRYCEPPHRVDFHLYWPRDRFRRRLCTDDILQVVDLDPMRKGGARDATDQASREIRDRPS